MICVKSPTMPVPAGHSGDDTRGLCIRALEPAIPDATRRDYRTRYSDARERSLDDVQRLDRRPASVRDLIGDVTVLSESIRPLHSDVDVLAVTGLRPTVCTGSRGGAFDQSDLVVAGAAGASLPSSLLTMVSARAAL